MLTTVVLIVVMLLLSAFFSGMEIAFTSKNRLKLEIDRKQNRMFDQIAEVFARHPGQYITTILVGNNIALVVYSLAMSLLLRSIYASLGWEQLARSGWTPPFRRSSSSSSPSFSLSRFSGTIPISITARWRR
jgi:putative hemolysin